jgi:hypothetical protein
MSDLHATWLRFRRNLEERGIDHLDFRTGVWLVVFAGIALTVELLFANLVYGGHGESQVGGLVGGTLIALIAGVIYVAAAWLEAGE